MDPKIKSLRRRLRDRIHATEPRRRRVVAAEYKECLGWGRHLGGANATVRLYVLAGLYGVCREEDERKESIEDVGGRREGDVNDVAMMLYRSEF